MTYRPRADTVGDAGSVNAEMGFWSPEASGSVGGSYTLSDSLESADVVSTSLDVANDGRWFR